ncbi:hypothetical protein GQX73_g132 [Xylaria multiplex]|uniref:Large ribosomal subunit protein mL40 n=1 Tax=Xylaria multiplex TaxID=323545 RepID=A0A7C8NE71_9PEZI|nr:hypothetical protein GQX73_g132 [Xylaria multiplex]
MSSPEMSCDPPGAAQIIPNGYLSIYSPTDHMITEQFYIPKTAYIEGLGEGTTETSWSTYLRRHNYCSAFMPLRGTERGRYRSIIEKSEAREIEKRQLAVETRAIILEAHSVVQRLLKTSKHYVSGGFSLSRLDEYITQPTRHTRQHPDFHKGHYKTEFGVFKACIIASEDWYLGHRPGDPIVHIKQNPVNRGTIPQGDMFYIPELAGGEDGDEIEIYPTRFEGVVPFNTLELYTRFVRYAFPSFVRMAIAAIGFDPRNPDYEVSGWTEAVDYIRTLEFEELLEDIAKILKLLRRIWAIKYGINTHNYPGFLKAQIATSISSLREMGWLMSRLGFDAPRLVNKAYWDDCKGLLEDFTGRDAILLAQEYFDITLANETRELLNNGDVDNVLFYKGKRMKFEDLYDTRGPGPEVGLQYCEDLRNVAAKYLSSEAYSQWLSQNPARKTSTATASTAGTKKGQRPGTNQDQDQDQDHDHPPVPSKKRSKAQDTSPQKRRRKQDGQGAKSVVPAKGSKKPGKKSKRKGKGDEPDPRIENLKASMPRTVPAPLRFARNRALRHWTIHRAWLLYQRKERERQAHELERMYQSMHNACEELRKTSGPGTREEGYLYRVAMEKHGMYGHNAVPIEYARPQTETPPRQAWNHEWTR